MVDDKYRKPGDGNVVLHQHVFAAGRIGNMEVKKKSSKITEETGGRPAAMLEKDLTKPYHSTSDQSWPPKATRHNR